MNRERLNTLAFQMVRYEQGAPHRVQHLLKVHSFAKLIGEASGLEEKKLETLEAAALVHDIGIRPSLEKYQHETGHLQEIEGPPAAGELLSELEFEPELIDRVCYLVGHHHTYTDIDGLDYQILVEADFLVNIFEAKLGKDEIRSIREKIFRTKSGTDLLDLMFLPE
ncbi:HD domain-containing protein [Massiliimalia massiliensis]|uniref:HD domain-containing protein n=1 Tax=Massiliimalia massiliensis TaxID=1852384 RepID=UPI000986BEF9|nr:HD domain-containing protein [Massiliimalia massiliensis]